MKKKGVGKKGEVGKTAVAKKEVVATKKEVVATKKEVAKKVVEKQGGTQAVTT